MDSGKIQLNDGNRIPKIGFGLYLIDEEHMLETVRTAYQTGYRLFDTASYYKNEEYFGSALKNLQINRADIQVATKAWPSELGYQGVKEALSRSLKKLQTDYVDYYFIHWPLKDEIKLSETWTAMEELKEEGLVRSIAVCNFQPHHLETIEKGHKYLPVINQIERHPLLTQEEVISYDCSKNIVTEAWSPLMRGSKVLDMEVIRRLSEKYEKTPA
jgi:diketogulonate reductase-like aldo/keto reductase